MTHDSLAAQPDAPITALEERFLTLIAENGPITIGDYLSDALCHPQHGYYSTQDPFGVGGDFTTAPEISQIFGELIGAWLIDAWGAIGAPSLVNVVELGPGRGTLMSDILRVGALQPAFLAAARLYLVESSGRLRVKQQRLLADQSVPIEWTDQLTDIPPGPTLVIANEFFDCLPIRQFIRTVDDSDTPWRERLVGINKQNGISRLCFVNSKTAYAERPGMPPGAHPEAIFEEPIGGRAVIEELATRFSEHKGRALIIDYGHGRSAYGDTLQAVRRHDYWHPLAAPGQADITVHVDFGALARAGREAGARIDGPVSQGAFLVRLGLEQRLRVLSEAVADQEARHQLIAGAERLIDPASMGTLFKVMAISSASLLEPPGFS